MVRSIPVGTYWGVSGDVLAERQEASFARGMAALAELNESLAAQRGEPTGPQPHLSVTVHGSTPAARSGKPTQRRQQPSPAAPAAQQSKSAEDELYDAAWGAPQRDDYGLPLSPALNAAEKELYDAAWGHTKVANRA